MESIHGISPELSREYQRKDDGAYCSSMHKRNGLALLLALLAVSACLGRMSGPGTAGGLAPYRVSKAALLAAEVQRKAREATGDDLRGAEPLGDLDPRGADAARAAQASVAG